MFAATVYLLCLLASCICAYLLVRTYLRKRTRLLLWSAACFVFLAINNLLVVFDILVFPDVYLAPLRPLASLAGVMTLLYGFVWELD